MKRVLVILALVLVAVGQSLASDLVVLKSGVAVKKIANIKSITFGDSSVVIKGDSEETIAVSAFDSFKFTASAVSSVQDVTDIERIRIEDNVIFLLSNASVINIYDLSGMVVKTAIGQSEISLKDLADGVYVVKIQDKTSSRTLKVIKR